MGMITLGYEPKSKFKWEELPEGFEGTEHNGKFVVRIDKLLWKKVLNIKYIQDKGYDALILIDGDRRTGKSTLGKTLGYLINPNITIDNYVSGMEEAPKKIEEAEEGSVLIFDEGSLVASSKDVMKRKSVQLSKIVDVCGVKKLVLIFCMPSFFSISRDIALHYSRFLLHVYTDEKLNRGRFAYFGKKKKKVLFEIGKKNFGSYRKPAAEWLGRFADFHLPFEIEYMKLKKQSLNEALGLDKKPKPLDRPKIVTELMVKFKENCPDVPNTIIAKGFGISKIEFYRRKKAYVVGKR